MDNNSFPHANVNYKMHPTQDSRGDSNLDTKKETNRESNRQVNTKRNGEINTNVRFTSDPKSEVQSIGSGPLTGIKVLDFTSLYPGPLLSLLLHDLGCMVVKAESPNKPDLLRSTSLSAFQALNRGKMSISMNFSEIREEDKSCTEKNDSCDKKYVNIDEKTQATFDLKWLRLWISKFDVILDSSRPGVLERRLHVKDIDEARQIWPHIIFVRLTAFGTLSTKPTNESKNCMIDSLKYVPSHDMNALSRAGVFSLIPTMGNHKLLPLPIQVVDILIAYSACTQTIAAIYKREMQKGSRSTNVNRDNHSNKVVENLAPGSLIDVSMYDAAISTLIMPLTEMLNHPKVDMTQGKDILCGSVPCYNIYKTADGMLSVGCIEAPFWRSFLRILGLESEYASMGFTMDYQQQQRIKEDIESKLVSKTAEEWETIFMIKNHLPVTMLRNLTKDRELIIQEMECRNMIAETTYGSKVVKPFLDYISFLGDAQNGELRQKKEESISNFQTVNNSPLSNNEESTPGFEVIGNKIPRTRFLQPAPGLGQHNFLLSSL